MERGGDAVGQQLRLGVAHGGRDGERDAGAGLDLAFERIPVQIDDARQHQQPGRIEPPVRFEIGADPGDAALGQQHVGHWLHAVGQQHPSPGDQQRHGGCPLRILALRILARGALCRAMLHLAKLAVGIGDIAHLRRVQAGRLRAQPPLRHLTRSAPRRAAEIIEGGSLYWVVAGAMLVRQRVLDVTLEQRDDGTPCAGLVLDRALVPVEGRPVKPFQGWRYLTAADAPADVAAQQEGAGTDALPAALQRELRALCLL